jgi:hypothetical protein
MSKINVTIAADAAAQPRPALATPAQIGPPAGVFFLIFDGEKVELSLTNAKSNTYKGSPHVLTRAVNPCHRETFLK